MNSTDFTVWHIVGIVVLVVLLIDWFNRSKIKRAQASGLYPKRGQGTDEDVKRLLSHGQKIMAIKLYREIHDVGLKDAKEAVERIAKEMP